MAMNLNSSLNIAQTSLVLYICTHMMKLTCRHVNNIYIRIYFIVCASKTLKFGDMLGYVAYVYIRETCTSSTVKVLRVGMYTLIYILIFESGYKDESDGRYMFIIHMLTVYRLCNV